MHLCLFLVTGLAAFATALPQRPGGDRGRFRGGRPDDQDGAVQAIDSKFPDVQFPGGQPPVSIPDNAQQENQDDVDEQGNLNNQGNGNTQGGLDNQGAGGIKQNGTNIGNNGQDNQNQGGQNQDDQNQDGQISNNDNQTTAFDASLVPAFGVEAGRNPDGEGNCLGLNDVKIPCSCPPDRQSFIQKVQAAAAAGNSEGVPVEFPLDDSSASEKARIQTTCSIVVLQNLNGRGVGCPAAATTFLAQLAAA